GACVRLAPGEGGPEFSQKRRAEDAVPGDASGSCIDAPVEGGQRSETVARDEVVRRGEPDEDAVLRAEDVVDSRQEIVDVVLQREQAAVVGAGARKAGTGPDRDRLRRLRIAGLVP